MWSSFYCCPMMHAPTFQLMQIAREKRCHESWKSTFFQPNPGALFHIINWNIAHGKLTCAITVAAVHGVYATVCIGSATVGIPLHMHSAGLTIFVGSFHNSRFGLFSIYKNSWKNRHLVVNSFCSIGFMCRGHTIWAEIRGNILYYLFSPCVSF